MCGAIRTPLPEKVGSNCCLQRLRRVNVCSVSACGRCVDRRISQGCSDAVPIRALLNVSDNVHRPVKGSFAFHCHVCANSATCDCCDPAHDCAQIPNLTRLSVACNSTHLKIS